jgi:hypothetical protein
MRARLEEFKLRLLRSSPHFLGVFSNSLNHILNPLNPLCHYSSCFVPSQKNHKWRFQKPQRLQDE